MSETNNPTQNAPQIAVIGNGSWATALVKILTDNGHFINWWMRKPSAVLNLKNNKHNPDYLSSVQFDSQLINPNNDLKQTIRQSSIILLATPSAYIKPLIDQIFEEGQTGKTIISAVKGILPDCELLINDYLKEKYNFPIQDYCAITGPCHAEEVAAERLSYLTFSSREEKKAVEVAGLFRCPYIRTIANHDLWGTQYAAVLKNVYAIGAGIAHGLGFGDNFMSVYATNCFREMHHFLLTQYKKYNPTHTNPDFHTSAYLGDLLVTCYSPFSRNRTLGTYIGKGYPLRAAFGEMNMVAEGYFGAKSLNAVNATLQIEMPIAEAIFEILWKGKPAVKQFADLKKRFL